MRIWRKKETNNIQPVVTDAVQVPVDSGAVSASAVDDGMLVRRYQAGDERALEMLFERYRRPLYSYFNRMLAGDRSVADDLFQELWIRAMRKLGNYREEGKLKSWLFTVAHNLVLEHFRRSRARNKIGMLTDEGELPEITESGHAHDDPAGLLAERELSVRLEEALALVTPEQREVFNLRQAGMSFKEIAELQGCPLNTALGRMHYVIKFLKRYLLD